jgi:2-polyprenyl-6-methoxyphenol hydroxylase-like FAD-dependent oxidoreductase
MTLATVSEYDPSAVPTRGDNAVVVGGSMAGLLAARVLTDGYDEVTILERDTMPDVSVARRGVPQANHVHAMLEPARVILNDLFPEYQEDLRADGGVILDAGTELTYYEQGDAIADTENELPMPCASRPLFESVARRHTFETAGLQIRSECHFLDYVANDAETAVTGVRFRNEDEKIEILDADVVVDATGRTSRTHHWLENHGYPTPPVDHVTVDLAYGTVTIERPVGETQAYLCAPDAPDTKGGTAIPVENGGLLVTLFGMHGDHPPTDKDSYIEFAGELASPELATLLKGREWISKDISRYPFPSSQWRHYERLDRFPGGLVVTGDAIASFNPIYGQGMSAAALDALQLHHTIADGADNIGLRFFERVESHIETIWRTAVGADFEFDETEGPKPLGADLFNQYVSWVIDTAHSNPTVSEEFARVLRLEKSPQTLLRPSIAARVLLPV